MTYRADQLLQVVIGQMKAKARKAGRAFKLKKPPPPRSIIGLQRQYLADLNQIVASLKRATNETVVANLDNINFEAKLNEPTTDSANARRHDDVIDSISRAMSAGRLRFMSEFSEPEIQKIAKQNASRIETFNGKEIDKMFAKVLNINLVRAEPYLETAMKGFVTNNVSLITSIAEQHFQRVEQTVLNGVQNGWLTSEIKEEVRKKYDVTESRAALIARDQTSKFNGNLNRLRQTELGIKKYEWSTSGDERVRPSHEEKDGNIYSWDNPPADTGNPGDDFQCRCSAIPVFEDLGE